MQDILQKTFKDTQIKPTYNLSDLIWARVERKMKIVSYVSLAIYSLCLIISTILLYNFIPSFYSEITSSWAYGTLSLVFSESIETISIIWKDLLYMFIESLPAASIISFAGIMFVFVMSLSKALDYKRKLFNF